MAQFSVATNFDSELICSITALNESARHSAVTEVYGALPRTITGGGRWARGLPPVTKNDLYDHLQLAHAHGIRFNYLLNGASPRMGGKFSEAFDAEIGCLREMGVDAITLADETLIKLVRRAFPDVEIHASIILGIDTAEKAEEYATMGVSVITPNQFTINRDKARLQELAEKVKSHGTRIRLYANVSCLDHCPRAAAHYMTMGRYSQEGQTNSPKYDPFLLWCMGQYYDKPVLLLQSPFIRPEAITAYEAFGIRDFKLSDRREPTRALVELYHAYLQGKFHGNLFSLLFREGRKWSNAVQEAVPPPSIRIDNNVLTGLDFDTKVLAYQGRALEKFYAEATGAAVRNVGESRGFQREIEKAAERWK